MERNATSQGDDCAGETPESAGNILLISHDAAMDDLRALVRARCLDDRRPSLKQLAGLSGVKLSRLRKLVENDPLERRGLNLGEVLSIWRVLGEDAVSLCLDRIGMRAESVEGEAERLSHAAAEMVGAGADLVKIAADGDIDADEADEAIAASDRAIMQAVALRAAAVKAKRGARR